jgi:hypothetical protein
MKGINTMKTNFRKHSFILIVLALVLLLSSCGSKSYENSLDAENGYYTTGSVYNYSSKGYDVYEDAAMEFAPAVKAETETVYGTAGDNSVSSVHLETSDRKIIYNAWADMQTTEYDSTISKLHNICALYGAYFESSNSYGGGTGSDSERSSRFTIRIPIESYSAFLRDVGSVGTVVSSGENNRDVTDEYFDIEARLESATIREERVLVLLENSGSLDDILALERELSDIRYEIESYTGKLRKYDSLISYATYNLTINEVIEYDPPVVKPRTFGDEIARSFKSGLDDFVRFWQEVAIWATYNVIGLSVFAVITASLIILIAVKVKKYKKKRAMQISENSPGESTEE